MKLLDILTAPWAIIPEKLIEIQNIYFTHLRGEKIDIKAIEAQIGKPLNNKKKTYQILEGVAVISVEGVLAKRANLFMDISGGTSMQLLERDINAAMEDPDVKSLLFYIDSPGGTVDGTQELANHIHSLRGRKPMISYAESLMGSAAYWIGSAADEIVMSGDTTQIGSIGVVATHIDVSKAEERMGYKTTEIVAGKFKRIASQYAPLSEEGKATIQDIVDHVYSIFVRDVANNRGVNEEKVLSDMADGRIFLGQKAIKAGLVDRMETLDGTIGRMSKRGTPEHTKMVMNNRIRMLQDEEREKTDAL
jgi:signal peptide peptidase SppA